MEKYSFLVLLEEIKNYLFRGIKQIWTIKRVLLFLNSIQKQKKLCLNILYKKSFSKYLKNYQFLTNSTGNNENLFGILKNIKNIFFNLNIKSKNRILRKNIYNIKLSIKKNLIIKKGIYNFYLKKLKRKFLIPIKTKVEIENNLPNNFKRSFYKKYLFYIYLFRLKSIYLFLLRINSELSWLKSIKRINYQKNSLLTRLSFYKIQCFPGGNSLRNNSYLINNFFNEKEKRNKSLLTLFYCPYNLQICKERNCLGKKNHMLFKFKENKNLKKSYFSIRNFSYFLINFNKFKKRLKKDSSGKKFQLSSIIGLSYLMPILILPGCNSKLIKNNSNLKENFRLILTIILSRLTRIFLKKEKSKLEQDFIKVLFENFKTFYKISLNFSKNYLLIFLYRIKDYFHIFIDKSNIKNKEKKYFGVEKFFSYFSHNILNNLPNSNRPNSIIHLLCKLCLRRKLLSFFKKKGPEKYEYLENISNSLFNFPFLKKFILDNLFDLVFSRQKEIFNFNPSNQSLSYYFSLLYKTSIRNFTEDFPETINLVTTIKKLKKFPDKFLFFIFLLFKKFFGKFSDINYSEISLKSLNILSNSFSFETPVIFLKNFLYEACNKKIFFKEIFFGGFKNLNLEILTIIGPNRDFLDFYPKNFKKFKRNLQLWYVRIIHLGHFSRTKKKFFLKFHFIRKLRLKKLFGPKNLKETGSFILKSLDKNLIRLFLLFEYEIEKNQINSFLFSKKNLFLQQIYSNTETFYQRSHRLFKKGLLNFKKKNHEQDWKLKFFEFQNIVKSITVRDNTDVNFYVKNAKESLKTCEILENLKKLFPNIFLLISLSFFEKNNENRILFNKLCFFTLFYSVSSTFKTGKKLQQLILNIFYVLEKSIKENFLLIKKTITDAFKKRFCLIFQLELIARVRNSHKKRVYFGEKIGKNTLNKNIMLNSTLVYDFSEYSFSITKRTIKRLY
jgi:hypothetical protein